MNGTRSRARETEQGLVRNANITRCGKTRFCESVASLLGKNGDRGQHWAFFHAVADRRGPSERRTVHRLFLQRSQRALRSRSLLHHAIAEMACLVATVRFVCPLVTQQRQAYYGYQILEAELGGSRVGIGWDMRGEMG